MHEQHEIAVAGSRGRDHLDIVNESADRAARGCLTRDDHGSFRIDSDEVDFGSTTASSDVRDPGVCHSNLACRQRLSLIASVVGLGYSGFPSPIRRRHSSEQSRRLIRLPALQPNRLLILLLFQHPFDRCPHPIAEPPPLGSWSRNHQQAFRFLPHPSRQSPRLQAPDRSTGLPPRPFRSQIARPMSESPADRLQLLARHLRRHRSGSASAGMNRRTLVAHPAQRPFRQPTNRLLRRWPFRMLPACRVLPCRPRVPRQCPGLRVTLGRLVSGRRLDLLVFALGDFPKKHRRHHCRHEAKARGQAESMPVWQRRSRKSVVSAPSSSL